ncbi:response regulator [Chitinispirillales bacterium ANBcel5]|uniref:response regulator n=1 Tax=Cellulosispirillum alkaliphilum TaxID=3039283 RepID=UPI002A506EA9|nr:response regulator [Chitinispirillales bacterium ANBcel5]
MNTDIIDIFKENFYFFVLVFTALYGFAFLYFLSSRFQHSRISRKFAFLLFTVFLWAQRDALGHLLTPYFSTSTNLFLTAALSIFYMIVVPVFFEIFITVYNANVPSTKRFNYLETVRKAAWIAILVIYILALLFPSAMYDNFDIVDNLYIYTSGPLMQAYLLLTFLLTAIPSLCLIFLSRKNFNSEPFCFGFGGVTSITIVTLTNFFPGTFGFYYRLGCLSIALFCMFSFYGIKRYGKAFSIAEILEERDKLVMTGKSLKHLLNIKDPEAIFQSICDYAREISESVGSAIIFFKQEKNFSAQIKSVSAQTNTQILLQFLKLNSSHLLEKDSLLYSQSQSSKTLQCDNLHSLLPSVISQQESKGLSEKLNIKQIVSYPFIFNEKTQGTVILFRDKIINNIDLYSVFAVQCSLVLKFSDQIKEIEQKRALEEQLHHARKMEAIGRLAGGIAHDFNNMLTGINGYAGLIKRKFSSGDATLSRYIDTISSAAKRSSDLVQQLLTFARKENIRSVPFDVHKTIKEVIHLLGASINKKISLDASLQSNNPIVTGDNTQIQNALLNIALNSRDAMPFGGSLTFQTTDSTIHPDKDTSDNSTQNFIMIKITDSGTGMSEEIKRHVFEPFFSTKQVGHGSGLGLASVYGIIKRHQGKITMESSPGEGTCVSILLPQSDSEYDQKNEPLPLIRGRGKILVVDDEQIIREMVETTLTELGYSVTCCCNGSEAVALYRSEHNSIDLVVLDIMMPVMDGFECLKHLKSINKSVNVIICTGHNPKEGKEDDSLNEISGYLNKPYDDLDLSIAISQALKKQSPAQKAKQVT